MSYSSIPVVLSLVFILPLEIAIFGRDFFGTNPPPLVINPGVYSALMGFDGLAALWSVMLVYRGIAVVSGFGRVRTMIVMLTVVLSIVVLFLISKLFLSP